MARMKYLMPLVALSLLTLAIACNRDNEEENYPSLRIDLSDAKSLKDNAKGIDGLRLNDSLASHFPGFITKIDWLKDTIVILDTWKDPGAYLYNSSGQQIKSYNDRGSGPADFLSLSDMNVVNGKLYLLDGVKDGKLIELNSNLEFVGCKPGEYQAQHFATSRDGSEKWFDRGNIGYDDNKDKLVYSKGTQRKGILAIPSDIENVTYSSYNVFAAADSDTILYLPPLEAKIYQCSGGKAEVLCTLDFNGKWPVFTENSDKSNPLGMMKDVHDKGQIYNANIFCDKSTVLIAFYSSDDLYLYLFDYRDLTPKGFFKVDKESLAGLGNIIGFRHGQLIFGEPGKLLYITI